MLALLCVLAVHSSSQPTLSAEARQELWESAKEKYLGVSEKLKSLGVNIELAKEDILHGRSPVDSLLNVNCVLTSENTMKVELEARSGGEEGAGNVSFAGTFEWGKEVERISGRGAVSSGPEGMSGEYSYNRKDGQNKWEVEGNRSIWDAKIQMGDEKAGPVAAGVKLGPLKVLVDPYVMVKEVIREAPEMVEAATQKVQEAAQKVQEVAQEAREKVGGVSTRVNLTNMAYALRNSTEPPPNFATNRLVVSIGALVKAVAEGQAATLGELNHIDGVQIDSESGEVLLYGTHQEGLQPIPADVFIALARSVYLSGSDPFISIDPDPAGYTKPMHTRIGGVPDELRDSELVSTMLAADYRMKRFVGGQDSVEGMHSVLELLQKRPEAWASPFGQRFWIKPRPLGQGDVRVGKAAGKTLFQFDSQPLICTEAILPDDLVSAGSTNHGESPDAEEAASSMTAHYQDIERLYPDSGFSQVRQILELSTAFSLLRKEAPGGKVSDTIGALGAIHVRSAVVPQSFPPLEVKIGSIGTVTYYLTGGVLDSPRLTQPQADAAAERTAGRLQVSGAGWSGDAAPLVDDVLGPRAMTAPELSAQFVDLARSALQTEDWQQAVKLAHKAHELDPKALEPVLTLARADAFGKQYDAMVGVASAAVELDKDSVDAHILKAFALFERGGTTKEWLDAVVNGTIREVARPVYLEIDAALKLNSNRGMTFFLCALLDSLALDDKAVILDTTAALEVEPHFMPALRFRAKRYFKTDDLAHALEDVTTYLTDSPKDAEMLELKTKILSALHTN